MASASYIPLLMPAGLTKPSSATDMPGRWYDGHLVRWINGVMHPMKGTVREYIVGAFPFASVVRAIHQWQDNSGVIWTGVLCEKNIYAISGGTSLDITPTGGFTGPPDRLEQGGYGDFTYNYDVYGTPRPDRPITKAIGPAWTLDNWGQNLLVMSSYDGRLFMWNPSTSATPAAVVSGAPVGNRCFVVTPERHVIIFGYAGVFNQFGWCDQQNITDWTPGVTSLAGSYTVEPAAPILTAKVTRFGTLFFTARAAYFTRYIGVPYVYSNERLSDGAVPISSAALVEFGGNAVWYSEDGFWRFDGSTTYPMASDLLDTVQQNSDPVLIRYRCFGVNLLNQSEIWWGYPRANQTENSDFVVWNFKENWWSRVIGMPRTCGFSGSYINPPLFSEGQNIIEHENGNFYTDVNMQLPYVSSSALNISSGADMLTINKIVPNTGGNPASLTYTLTATLQRSDGTKIVNNTGPMQTWPDGLLRFSLTGRDIRLMIQQASNGALPWTIGQMLINAARRGKL